MSVRELTKEAFGKAVRLARRSKGLTQKELAERANISQSAVSDTERAESFRYENLSKIACALDMRMSELTRVGEVLQEAHGKARRFYDGLIGLVKLTEPDELDALVEEALGVE